MGVRFRRQQPIGLYIVDFYCAEKKALIELDGGQHNAAQKAYDVKRDAWLKAAGYRVLRFWNHEWFEHSNVILKRIYDEIHSPLEGESNPSKTDSEGGA